MDPVNLSIVTDAQLLAQLIDCERMVMRGLLHGGDAAICAFVHDMARDRIFAGNAQALLSWWSAWMPLVQLEPFP